MGPQKRGLWGRGKEKPFKEAQNLIKENIRSIKTKWWYKTLR